MAIKEPRTTTSPPRHHRDSIFLYPSFPHTRYPLSSPPNPHRRSPHLQIHHLRCPLRPPTFLRHISLLAILVGDTPSVLCSHQSLSNLFEAEQSREKIKAISQSEAVNPQKSFDSTTPELVKRWSDEVQEVVQSRVALVQFHALALLHQNLIITLVEGDEKNLKPLL